MTATAKVAIKVIVKGLGSDCELAVSSTNSVTPEEVYKGYAVIGSTACNLDLGTIEDTDLTGVLIIAKGTADTDFVGILPNDNGEGTPSTTVGNIVLNAGEFTYLNFYGGLTDEYVIRLKGSASTTAIEYILFGAHT